MLIFYVVHFGAAENPLVSEGRSPRSWGPGGASPTRLCNSLARLHPRGVSLSHRSWPLSCPRRPPAAHPLPLARRLPELTPPRAGDSGRMQPRNAPFTGLGVQLAPPRPAGLQPLFFLSGNSLAATSACSQPPPGYRCTHAVIPIQNP